MTILFKNTEDAKRIINTQLSQASEIESRYKAGEDIHQKMNIWRDVTIKQLQTINQDWANDFKNVTFPALTQRSRLDYLPLGGNDRGISPRYNHSTNHYQQNNNEDLNRLTKGIDMLQGLLQVIPHCKIAADENLGGNNKNNSLIQIINNAGNNNNVNAIAGEHNYQSSHSQNIGTDEILSKLREIGIPEVDLIEAKRICSIPSEQKETQGRAWLDKVILGIKDWFNDTTANISAAAAINLLTQAGGTLFNLAN